MKAIIWGALAATVLAGCGVNGAPTPPAGPNGVTPPAVQIRGEARVGVAGSF